MSTRFQFNKGPLFDGGSPRDMSLVAYEPGIYLAETTQRFIPGTRYITWDGRVFKYSLATGTVGGGRLAYHKADVATYGVAYTTVGDTQVAGDRQITIDTQTFVEDVLAGGLVLLYGADYTYVQQRGIIGNDAVSGTTVTINLDAPLITGITEDSTGIEVQPNPYRYIGIVETYGSCSGLPCTRATSGQFFWQQTWGMCNVEPGMTIGASSLDRQLVTGYGAGAVYYHDTTHAITDQCQHAGYILDSGNAPVPFVMLQISI